jgi:alpha-1,2-mannosyltransferase
MTRGEASRRKQRSAGAFLLILTVINAAMFFQLVPKLRNGYQDFTAFYGGGAMLRTGQTAHLYELAAQYQLQIRFAPSVKIRSAALPYNHPPFEALLFVPFTYMSYVTAYQLWVFLNILMVAASLWIVRKKYADVGRLSSVFVILAATAFVPIVNALMQGQDSILFALLLTLSLGCLEEGKDVRGGMALGASLFKFHLVLPLALILTLRRPRLLLGFAPIAVLLGAVSIVMVGWSGMAEYARVLFQMEKQGAGGADIVGMPNLRGLIAGLPGVDGGTALWLTIACSMTVAGIAIWQITRPDTSIRFVFAIGSVTSVMVSYHTLTHDLVWLLPVLLILFATCQTNAQETKADVMLLVSVYLVLWGGRMWPHLTPWWWIPTLMWIFSKLRRGQISEAVA